MATSLHVLVTLQIISCCMVCYASNPNACCTPKQWQATVIQDGSSISQKKGLGVSLLTGKISVYYDSINKRVRIDEENSLNPVNITTIHDLGKNISYYIYGTNCTMSVLKGKFADFCVPKNSSYNGNRTLGGSLVVDAWGLHFEDSSKFARIDVTRDKCIPVTETFFQSSVKTSSAVYATNVFSNVQSAISSPKVFDKPTVCTNAIKSSVQMDVDLRAMLWERGLNNGRPSPGHFMKLHSSQLLMQSVDTVYNHYVEYRRKLKENGGNNFKLSEMEALRKIINNNIF
ncbi:uncharacterized protein TRIADDRAFT_53030 [Trichoplax adhaerens]|uniref:Mammalian ependymin-related protein 1 n=1 Tax=Trichoplax adhaerens TaxID=10228 RepID=B3RN41_TRIAD|nr:hypothetical protein TRIADDRAFT_53030 [Trichoplax adhaerens]EDV27956.1 hypothetical protein TRIADDRAFT_53030 [Trichoplax adhaerens]|eukprot:XP_002109790.1 hypothetical protein TRIADDRAFT_53030 [Trichoplax adhaerens]